MCESKFIELVASFSRSRPTKKEMENNNIQQRNWLSFIILALETLREGGQNDVIYVTMVAMETD